MDDFAFNIPKKILRWLLLVAAVIAFIYGLVTWDSNKAVNFYFKEVEFISRPIVNKMTKRLDRAMGRILPRVIPNPGESEK